MAVTLNANTSTGFIATSDTSGVLQLQTGGTAAVTVDASQNVGIGVTPSAFGSGSYKALQIGGSLSFMGRAGGSDAYMMSNTYFDQTNYKYVASLAAARYTQNGGEHQWFNAASGTAGNTISFTQAMTLNANGVLALQGASTSANGVGITFPATQSASSDANTLDDYEEGTWTPALGGTWTSNPTGLSGHYTKIGRLVTVYLDFNNGTKASSISGYFTGLPFTTSINGTGAVTDSNVTNNGLALAANTNRIWLTGTSFNSGTFVVVNYMTST